MKLFKPIVLWLALVTSVSAGEVELADLLLQSHHNNQLIPLVSLINPQLSVEQAYIVQAHYVRGRNEKLVGFKAGLTSQAVQKKFQVNQALAGVLFASGDLSATTSLSQFQRLMLETELGFEIGKAIRGVVANKAELKQYIKAVLPVIELPELGFAGKPTVVDIIAANVGSAAFIKGKPVTDLSDLDLNALKVTLTRNGETVNVGLGRDALGDQWQAALWLVNRLIGLGRTLEPGQFVITGAMGKMIKAEAGDYKADFGKLGVISFSIEP
ncbi:4-oxalocrotonate decarboxylase [Candidatus Thiomargarita nelsonii]|uniref:4-oxalocrotonate decarboxylase n=1 Tax=Candidatus Thiomargarita nelsonii TaxID=1003181 RepID=A0A176S295_9GAMM|nr:4-oxalocrotonate decarboxylase [Candidatus Thiomargarita nelsonii]